jgi:hypothetical protein
MSRIRQLKKLNRKQKVVFLHETSYVYSVSNFIYPARETKLAINGYMWSPSQSGHIIPEIEGMGGPQGRSGRRGERTHFALTGNRAPIVQPERPSRLVLF